ncbi:hypothetical protein ACI48J_04985 [Paenibacillus chitinolyticus]|uniref:hypothetical protein n=1 Tax=Paenibacillus chitinolyticus TaxID=79263 RepID=UPI00386CB32A
MSKMDWNSLLHENLTAYNKENIKICDFKEPVILFFTSLSCVHCIDLLPNLNEISDLDTQAKIILFSDGEIEEIADMRQYFNWEFTVIPYDDAEKQNLFTDLKFPFMAKFDEHKNLITQGTIYNTDDYKAAMNHMEAMNFIERR